MRDSKQVVKELDKINQEIKSYGKGFEQFSPHWLHNSDRMKNLWEKIQQVWILMIQEHYQKTKDENHKHAIVPKLLQIGISILCWYRRPSRLVVSIWAIFYEPR